MGLKKSLLNRLSRREGAGQSHAEFPMSGSPHDKCKFVADRVEETVLPRKIIFTTGGSRIELIVANQRLYQVSFDFEGDSRFEHAFDGKEASSRVRALIHAGMGSFFESDGMMDIEIKVIDHPPKGTDGVVPDILILEKIEPVITLVSKPEVARKPKIPVSNVPARFFDDTSDVAHESIQFSGDDDTLSSFTDIHRKFAPHLGDELLFIVLGDGDTKDTFAFAMNGEGGTAVELDRQKIGRIHQSWSKLVDKS